MTCRGCISAGSSRMSRTVFSVIEPSGLLVPEDRDAAHLGDVGGEPVDVRRDDARARVQPMAADQARDRDLTVRLGEVRDHREHAHVDAVVLDVGPATRIDGDPLVVQDLLLEAGLVPVEALDERLQPDCAVQVLRARSCGRRTRCCLRARAPSPRRRASRHGRARRFVSVRSLRPGGRHGATVAAGAKNGEGQRPVDVVPRGDADELVGEGRLQTARGRRRIR